MSKRKRKQEEQGVFRGGAGMVEAGGLENGRSGSKDVWRRGNGAEAVVW